MDRVTVVLPPEYLLEDCPVPSSGVLDTNGALADFTTRLKNALKVCNADKAALRTWREDPTASEVGAGDSD